MKKRREGEEVEGGRGRRLYERRIGWKKKEKKKKKKRNEKKKIAKEIALS